MSFAIGPWPHRAERAFSPPLGLVAGGKLALARMICAATVTGFACAHL
jgi:hypothetical protein